MRSNIADKNERTGNSIMFFFLIFINILCWLWTKVLNKHWLHTTIENIFLI
jgi:predicted nucleic acid-binding Zn ribbon protein